MNTETIKSCPKCQAPIPPEAPQGLCPKCLLASASVPTETGQSGDESLPPSLETIAAAFPQLEILEFIGQGGMGLVFKARQPKLDRFVALKLLPQKPGADPTSGERFNREARMLARLGHPNIVAVHDFGQAGMFFYLIMEFVDGVNLRQAMRAGRFTPAQALALVPKICDALQYAHEEGVLHRDIKPENLLLDTRGRLKIADFGIAKLLGEAKDITLTARGSAIGTPHYMAPEQLERPQDVDQRADVYSLGVVFYEMLTGELPIGRFAPPSEKAAMDPRVDEVVMRALEKERERRFQSAGDVKTHVEKITASPAANTSVPVGAEPPPRTPPVQPDLAPTSSSSPSGWSLRAISAAALVGVSLLVLALAIVMGRHIGPAETVVLLVLIGFPALAGTLQAWFALRDFRASPGERRGARLAFLSAVAWPVILLDLGLLLILVLFVKNLGVVIFHVRNGSLIEMVAAIGGLMIVVLDVFVVRHLLKGWTSKRALPHADLLSQFNRWPRSVRWLSAYGVILFFLVVMVGPRQGRRMEEAASVAPANEPTAPPGYEVAPGGLPGNDNRVYRSVATIPPGYALTVVALLSSNQVVLKPGLPISAASLLAPEGQLPVQARLTWRLLGNTTLADGAPLQLSLGVMQSPENEDKSFHVATPEPVAVDWAGEPAQVWPPQNGHTKFLLIKGMSGNTGAEAQLPTEWAVGIETRLDPIPENVLHDLKSPSVRLGINWLATAVAPETVAEYRTICGLIEGLNKREQGLLVQFTPDNTWVKQVREQIASKRRIKKQLENEHPGLALINTPDVQSEVSGE